MLAAFNVLVAFNVFVAFTNVLVPLIDKVFLCLSLFRKHVCYTFTKLKGVYLLIGILHLKWTIVRHELCRL